MVFGASGFIARHIVKAAQDCGVAIQAVSHTENPDNWIDANDSVICCGLHPELRDRPYRAELDFDMRLALVARKKRAHFTMLSTRRVYPEGYRWGAEEEFPAGGDETLYGRNKALCENSVMNVSEGQATILRLSNIFGFELAPRNVRRSFFGMLLETLRSEQRIYFDMHPETQRDFLPVEVCAKSILKLALKRSSGIWNLGCGFPVHCGILASWVMNGYGAGKLVAKNDVVRDAFYLNTKKWQGVFGPTIVPDQLREYCELLGRRLQNA